MVSPRVLRGGCWGNALNYLRSVSAVAVSAVERPDARNRYIGFRPVREPESRHILRGGSLISIARIARAGSYYTIPYNRTPCLGFRLVRERI